LGLAKPIFKISHKGLVGPSLKTTLWLEMQGFTVLSWAFPDAFSLSHRDKEPQMRLDQTRCKIISNK
jgi:hypothetical protein